MSISTTCPSCQKVYLLADHLRGKKVRCKNCDEVISVGGAEERNDERSGRQQRIQSEARRPNRAPQYDEDDDERPRRRERDERRKGNTGLIIGLIAGGGVLLLMLVGGGILAVVFLLRGKIADQPSNVPLPPNMVAGGNPARAQPRPGFRGEMAPPGTVIVHATGIANEFMREAVQEKLGKLADEGPGRHVFAHNVNGQATFRISPVRDPKAFAAKIDFGTVNSVEGQVITMAVGKLEGVPDANADGVTKALFELKSSNIAKRHNALRILKGALPDQRRAEVCKALEPLINNSDHFTREWTIESLGIWGTKETVPLLIKAMNDKETRQPAMKALGRLKDERAIEPIAARLEDNFDRREAGEALKRIGPAVEEAVTKRLNHPDWQVGVAACEVLRAVGTKRSIPALQVAIAQNNFFVAPKANEAIRAINARQGN